MKPPESETAAPIRAADVLIPWCGFSSFANHYTGYAPLNARDAGCSSIIPMFFAILAAPCGTVGFIAQ
ncbi:hypothetical protein [Lysobacter sp. TAB13]|uniref:hypothetical protein n=1 Tax=Lysobacter sp. TAB13 TaxID=3233065 RepID=UPI003F9A3073